MAAAWHLAPALVDLRAELDQLAPHRDRRSDGTVGDLAHQQTGSKHNPNAQGVVRAFDADKTGPWPAGVTFDRIVATLVLRHRVGLDDRLQNIIWNRRIWSRTWGWSARPYTGPNAHTEHGHFEVRDQAAYWNKRGPWGLLELEDDVSEQDVTNALTKFFARGTQPDKGGITSRIGRDALDQGIPNGVTGDKTPAWIAVRDLGTQVMQIKALLTALTGRDFTDEAAIVAGVLEGLGGSTQSDAELAAALRAALGDRAAAVGQLLAAHQA
jgi:hypothetical protein